MNTTRLQKSVSLATRTAALAMALAVCVPTMSAAGAASPQPQAATQSAGRVTCEVLDSTGEPVIGASVKPADSKLQPVVTDIDGRFSYSSTKPVKVTISYVGCRDKTVELRPGVPMTVTLEDEAAALEELVVVGFAVQKKVNLTGSVGTATAKDLAGRPVQSTAAALQGVIPGLNISNSSAGGELNASKSVNIRGVATISSNSSDSPLILIDGMEGDINTLNPADIDNISVLKDAAASSIYGSRAPFGVILITTKSGSKGKSTIHYSNSFRFNKPLNPMRMMDSWEYINYLDDVQSYTSNKKEFTDDFREGAYAYYTGESDNFIYDNKWVTPSNGGPSYRRWGTGECSGTFANVNWVDELYKKTAFAQEHNVSLNGGNEKVNYYVSGNFLDQNGFLKYGNDSYDRYSIMGKFSAQMTDWLNIQYTGRWIRTEYNRPTIFTGGFYEKVIRRLTPLNPVYDPNGYYASDYNYIVQLDEGGRHKDQDDAFTNQVKIVATPLKGWNIIGELNARINSNWTHEDRTPVYTHDADDLDGLSAESVHLAFDEPDHSSVYEYAYRSTYLNYNIYSDYTFNFAEKNNMKFLLGFQGEDFKYRDLHANRNDLLTNDLPILDLTTSTDSYGLGSQYQKWRTVGFFGRINYDYDSKYLLEVNLRYDGSSRFRKQHRWVWSPSASAGWNVDREAFWEPIRPVVNAFKVRGSYGQLSNQNTKNWYPTYRTIWVGNQASNWLVNDIKSTASSFPTLITTSLTWEKIRNANIGFDFSLFRYRLTGSFDYYWRTTSDMMGPPLTYPAVLGAVIPEENTLSLRTSGWELQLGWQDHIGDFAYSAKLNLSDDRTKILEYPNDERYLGKYTAGEYIGNIYGLTTIGVARTDEEMNAHLANVNQDAIGSNWQGGDMMYKDIDGNGQITKGTTLDNLGDLKKIGNSSPRYRFGLNLYAQWKGIDVTAFFQGVLKRDYYFNPNNGSGTGGKSAVFWGATSGGRWESIFLKEHLDYWRDENSLLGENRDAYYARPLYYTNKNRETQTRYLQNAAYMRLKNLQVGYTFPRAWTEKWACTNFRLFFSAENLFTVTKMSKVIDPESLEVSSMKSGSSYPLAKTFSFGLTLDF